MLSRALIRSPQFGQCDGGETIDSPRGTRQMTTLRKLPAHAPRIAAYIDSSRTRARARLLRGRQLTPGVLHEPCRAGRGNSTERVRVERDRRGRARTTAGLADLDAAPVVDDDPAEDGHLTAGGHDGRARARYRRGA